MKVYMFIFFLTLVKKFNFHDIQDYESGARVNVTTQLGSTTYLHCKVNRLGGKTVRILQN
jgi:hypothetical protein